jgi:hypothetical protein
MSDEHVTRVAGSAYGSAEDSTPSVGSPTGCYAQWEQAYERFQQRYYTLKETIEDYDAMMRRFRVPLPEQWTEVTDALAAFDESIENVEYYPDYCPQEFADWEDNALIDVESAIVSLHHLKFHDLEAEAERLYRALRTQLRLEEDRLQAEREEARRERWAEIDAEFAALQQHREARDAGR